MSVRLDRTTWRTLVSTVRLGPAEYRVIRPARSSGHAPVYESYLGAQLTVDEAAAAELAVAWWLASRSRHSIVHLPLRSSDYDCGACCGETGVRLDLVLLHHSLGFPVSRWKEVRARLTGGAPQTVQLPANPFDRARPHDPHRWTHREYQDHLRWDIAADTFFVIGSRPAFEFHADDIRALTEDFQRGQHHCAEVEVGTRGFSQHHQRRPWSQLHVDRCLRH